MLREDREDQKREREERGEREERKERKEEEEGVWKDEDDEEVEVDLNEKSRLRKLKETEGETVVTGTEYQKRLNHYYQNTLNKTTFFSWAQKHTH